MPAYFLISVQINDEEDRAPYDEYIRQVIPIVESYGGKYIIRSEKITYMTGTWRPDRMIVIEFPSKKEIDACFTSKEYIKISGLRVNKALSQTIVVET